MTPASLRFALFLAQVLVALAVAACASGSVVNHAFSFDANGESPEVEVLDFLYGDSKLSMTRNPEYLRKQGKSLQGAGIYGEMLPGDFLYVKWRIRGTGHVYEDKVDLRHRLPADITNHRIHFIIKGPQLYVYLVTPEPRPKDVPPNGPRTYQYLKT